MCIFTRFTYFQRKGGGDFGFFSGIEDLKNSLKAPKTHEKWRLIPSNIRKWVLGFANKQKFSDGK